MMDKFIRKRIETEYEKIRAAQEIIDTIRVECPHEYTIFVENPPENATYGQKWIRETCIACDLPVGKRRG